MGFSALGGGNTVHKGLKKFVRYLIRNGWFVPPPPLATYERRAIHSFVNDCQSRTLEI